MDQRFALKLESVIEDDKTLSKVSVVDLWSLASLPTNLQVDAECREITSEILVADEDQYSFLVALLCDTSRSQIQLFKAILNLKNELNLEFKPVVAKYLDSDTLSNLAILKTSSSADQVTLQIVAKDFESEKVSVWELAIAKDKALAFTKKNTISNVGCFSCFKFQSDSSSDSNRCLFNRENQTLDEKSGSLRRNPIIEARSADSTILGSVAWDKDVSPVLTTMISVVCKPESAKEGSAECVSVF